MNEIRHLVVGPRRHGVVLHAEQIARACGHPVVRLAHARDLDPDQLRGARVVHVAFTDRLFGATIDEAVSAMTEVARLVHRSGAELSLTVHDVPHDDSALQVRRARGYAAVVALARGVVVNSGVELAVIAPMGGGLRSLQLIRLPVLPAPQSGPTPGPAPATCSVGVLGFVYPDRGYDDVLAALPPGAELVAIGQPAAGHAALVDEYAGLAASLGVGWRMTGYLDDDVLASTLAAVDVPIAPNRRVTASGSINSWTSVGRRVLVPDSPYTRELLSIRPDAVQVYDPADPDDLARRIARGLADRATTVLTGERPGASLADCADAYRDHLRACLPARAVAVARDRWVVPDNRWDLLRAVDRAPASVSVVVPYFQAQADLDRLLTGLAAQTHPRERLEVIVADDGSSRPPVLDAADGLTIRTVRQDDEGFRAAAARNLGVSVAEGEVIAFLDADMVPEPHYLELVTRLPAAAPDCLTVGRRRHAALDGWGPSDVRTWLAGGVAPEELTEPDWLRAEYERTHGLLQHVDARSYRYVISAVMAVHRDLFLDVRGFDESFTRYGGEDWEFAHRAWVGGAVFAHVRDAVAWHNGPDWAARADARTRAQDKQQESLQLARVLPDPVARAGRAYPQRPAIVVRLAGLDVVAARAAARSLRGVDCALWHPDRGVVAGVGAANVFHGEPTPDALASCSTVVDVGAAADLAALPRWAADAERVGMVRAGPVTVRSNRLLNRARRWRGSTGADVVPLLMGRLDLP